MRKLFLAALALVAFAALPAVASAAPAELRDEAKADPGSIVLTSGDLTTTSAGGVVACTESEVKATRRSIGRYTVRSSRFQGGGSPAPHCPVIGPPTGRVNAEVRPVRFRDEIHFRNVNGTIRVHTRADFEIGFRDPNLGGLFRECKFHTTIEGTMVGNVITIDTNNPVTLTEDRFNTGCPSTAALNGHIEVTDREGGEVTAH